jgi:phospholipid-hydroperoxide glutathione peroxidase
MLGFTTIFISAGLLIAVGQVSAFDQEKDWSKAENIYDFTVKDIHGNDVPLETYRGHVLIIVNVASECGLTDTNYKQLVELHEKYGESKGLRILAFPSNQFGGQEPGTPQQIIDFAKGYNVKFDLFEKIDVNGDNAHPLYKWLKSQQGGFIIDAIKWNFTKFIVNKEGKVVERISPTVEPMAMEMTLSVYF